MNLAIFGGSFNPPHSGHIDVIRKSLELEFIDTLIVLPNFQNPLKNAKLVCNDRIAVLHSLTAGLKNAKDKLIISNYEIAKQTPSYSIESIKYFKNLYKPNEMYFIIGADILAELGQWYKIELIKKEVKFIVASRDNIKIPSNFLQINIKNPSSSTKIREMTIKPNNFLGRI